MLAVTLLVAFLCGYIFYLLKIVRDVRHLRSMVRAIPGEINLIGMISPWGNLVQKQDNWIVSGAMNAWASRRNFEKSGWDIYSLTSSLPMENSIVISDAAAIKRVTADRHLFPKPMHIYESLNAFGFNIVYSDGDIWKRFRKVSSPAFSDRNNKVVWDEAMYLMDEFDKDSERWANGTCDMDNFLDYALEVAIRIICAAGFGERSSMTQSLINGHQITFPDCLKIISKDFAILYIVPKWFPNINDKLKTARLALTEFGTYLNEMIENRRGKREERYDLFSTLLEGYEEPSGDQYLTKEEVLGNMYMFIIAGHETTAHMLCFAFALLALYPEVQEKLYKHCKEVYPTDHEPTYHDMPLFSYSLWVLYETLRLCPIIPSIPKLVTEDIGLTIGNQFNETEVFPVPKGSMVILHALGLHHNPRYWKDPKQFIPERFSDPDWPRDAFLPFSGGSRSCLGRKFTETEAVVILTRLIMKYKVSILEEPQFKNETFEERKQRVLNADLGITITPKRTPLTFSRRE